jgi:rhodanese-related sulfurtransferase
MDGVQTMAAIKLTKTGVITGALCLFLSVSLLFGCDQQQGRGVETPPETTPSETIPPPTPSDETQKTEELSGAETASVPDDVWVSASQLQTQIDEDAVLVIDLRSYLEYSTGCVPKAQIIPLRFLERRFREIPEDTEICFVCSSEAEAAQAYAVLTSLTYESGKIHFLEGGMAAWREAGFPTQVSPPRVGC